MTSSNVLDLGPPPKYALFQPIPINIVKVLTNVPSYQDSGQD